MKALWVAENCTGTLHNLYTLRGAEVRDGNKWANYIMEAHTRYGACLPARLGNAPHKHPVNACHLTPHASTIQRNSVRVPLWYAGASIAT